jgi:hypothetical protein
MASPSAPGQFCVLGFVFCVLSQLPNPCVDSFFKGITKNPKPQPPLRVETISALVNRASGVSRVIFGTCLPVRVCFFVPKAASSLAQAFFFTESYDPVGSYL